MDIRLAYSVHLGSIGHQKENQHFRSVTPLCTLRLGVNENEKETAARDSDQGAREPGLAPNPY